MRDETRRDRPHLPPTPLLRSRSPDVLPDPDRIPPFDDDLPTTDVTGETPATEPVVVAPVEVALYEPEIPGNAGNVARLCAATGTALHLIGRLGFSFTHPKAKRAVMDYWNHLRWAHHVALGDFLSTVEGRRVWCFTARGTTELWEAEFAPGDVLLFGPESRGLPEEVVAAAGGRAVRIPMIRQARSLNLGNAVAIGLYEALRQTREEGGGDGPGRPSER